MASTRFSRAMLRGGSMNEDVKKTQRTKIIERTTTMLLVLGVVAAALIGWGLLRAFFIGKFLAEFKNQVQTVATMKAVETPWQSNIQSVGTITAVNGASLSAQVAGIVATINFHSGEDVKQGDVLLTLRADSDPAVLAQLQAQARLAAINYERDKKQFAIHAVSKAQLDTDFANMEAANAQVQAQQETIDEKTVRAPFSGRLGIRQVDIGQYLSAGTEIVTLEQLNPLYVDFYLPQQDLSALQVGQSVNVGLDAYPDQSFPAQIIAIGATVTQDTRSVAVRAQLQNPGLSLRPGMFATVFVDVGTPKEAITLPQTVITYNSYGDTVYVVDHSQDKAGHQQLTARQVFVTLGATRGDQVQVLSGIQPNEDVVTAGQLKLRNGSLLAINNSIQASDSPNPNPPNE